MLFRRTASGVPVHFLHVGKTGGTAIVEALTPFAATSGIVLHSHSTRLSDVPREDRAFFFVRHPIPRFVSGFFSRLRQGAPRYHYAWSESEAGAFSIFQTANDLAEALSSPDEERSMIARNAMHSIQHVRSHYTDWFLGEQEIQERLESIVLIGLQEKLPQDFEYLKKQLCLPPSVQLPEDEVLAHRTPKGFNRRLSPMAERNLQEWYADDIRFYDFCLRARESRGLHGVARLSAK